MIGNMIRTNGGTPRIFRDASLSEKKPVATNRDIFSDYTVRTTLFRDTLRGQVVCLFPFPMHCRVALPFSNDSWIFALFGIGKPTFCRDMSSHFLTVWLPPLASNARRLGLSGGGLCGWRKGNTFSIPTLLCRDTPPRLRQTAQLGVRPTMRRLGLSPRNDRLSGWD
jgi:hypothetical protein